MRITKPVRTHFAVTSNYISHGMLMLRGALRALHGSTDGLDCAAYGRFIQRCADRRLLRQGSQLHARLVLFSVVPNNFLASKLIAFYSKTDRPEIARKVFDQIPQPNAFSLNAMLIAYSLHGLHGNSMGLLSSLVSGSSGSLKADNFTATCVLKAVAASFPDPRLAREVHCYVVRHGFDSDLFVGNALVACYAKCDELGFARVLFERMPERDIVSWNSMVAGYSQCGYYEECKVLFKEMVGSTEVRPNGVTLVSVFQACGQSKDIYFGMDVHSYLHENLIDMDVPLCNAVVSFYAKCGSLDYARELFESMHEKDEVTYGSIISAYMAHGFVNEALDLFHMMPNPRLNTWNAVISGLVQNNWHEYVLGLFCTMLAQGFRPNSVTLSSVLPTISHYTYLKGGKEVHAYAIRNNYAQNIYVITAIVDTYAKSGFLPGAKLVFDCSKVKSLIIWTAIISAYAAHGDAFMSLYLFDEKVSHGIQPDEVTFTAVLTSCGHSGVVDEASKIFNSMALRYGIEPQMEHYACLVSVLSRAGRLSEAADFISKMPMKPSAKIWGALLNGAAVASDVETGKFVCDRLFEMEPENTGNYVIMANLYSQAGRSDEADEVRERMNRIGLKKVAGSSWIETND